MSTAAIKETFFEPSPRTAEVSSTSQFVTFTCGERAFGIDIMSVREIRSWSPVTALPGQPYGALGVLDIRGQIVEVFDLAGLIGSVTGSEHKSRVVLVVSLDTRDVGILVDSVSDIIFARDEDMRPVPASTGSEPPVSGLVKSQERLVAILNLGVLFPPASPH